MVFPESCASWPFIRSEFQCSTQKHSKKMTNFCSADILNLWNTKKRYANANIRLPQCSRLLWHYKYTMYNIVNWDFNKQKTSKKTRVYSSSDHRCVWGQNLNLRAAVVANRSISGIVASQNIQDISPPLKLWVNMLFLTYNIFLSGDWGRGFGHHGHPLATPLALDVTMYHCSVHGQWRL